MKRIVLLHGSWHGAWCWHKVAPRLRSERAEVLVPNLPGRGRDAAHPYSVTLSRMIREVATYLDPRTPSTLVAHSRYGILATALAEAHPDRISRVVYLASYMLASGERAVDAFALDSDSYLRDHVSVDRWRARDTLAPEAYVEGLYADCSAEDIELATSLLCREPSLPAMARVRTTEAGFGRVPKAYIRLLRDRAVSPTLQDRMISRTLPERVESLDASHSAYFSIPDQLARTILAIDRD